MISIISRSPMSALGLFGMPVSFLLLTMRSPCEVKTIKLKDRLAMAFKIDAYLKRLLNFKLKATQIFCMLT